MQHVFGEIVRSRIISKILNFLTWTMAESLLLPHYQTICSFSPFPVDVRFQKTCQVYRNVSRHCSCKIHIWNYAQLCGCSLKLPFFVGGVRDEKKHIINMRVTPFFLFKTCCAKIVLCLPPPESATPTMCMTPTWVPFSLPAHPWLPHFKPICCSLHKSNKTQVPGILVK